MMPAIHEMTAKGTPTAGTASATGLDPGTEAKQKMSRWEKALREKDHLGAALLESEKRYRRLFESAKDGILILDADSGKIVDANPFISQLLGYPHEEMCGKHLWELGVFRDIAASREAFQTLQENHYIRYEDLPLETRDGQAIAVEFVSNVYLEGDNRVIQCNIRDVTARKREEAERQRLADQLQQARKMEAVGLLAGGVAHDYNNALTIIIGHTELALQKVSPSQAIHADLTQILKAATRSADITRKLQTFARKQAITPVELDINQTVENMRPTLENLLEKQEGELLFLPEDRFCKTRIDPDQLGQILINLCLNAKEAIAPGGRIAITTGSGILAADEQSAHPEFAAEEYVRLAVSDNGRGMEQKTIDQIFTPFFTRKEVGQGPGLGLSMVYGIVLQNRGFIKVHSEPGQGSTFTVYLPRIAD